MNLCIYKSFNLYHTNRIKFIQKKTIFFVIFEEDKTYIQYFYYTSVLLYIIQKEIR